MRLIRSHVGLWYTVRKITVNIFGKSKYCELARLFCWIILIKIPPQKNQPTTWQRTGDSPRRDAPFVSLLNIVTAVSIFIYGFPVSNTIQMCFSGFQINAYTLHDLRPNANFVLNTSFQVSGIMHYVFPSEKMKSYASWSN